MNLCVWCKQILRFTVWSLLLASLFKTKKCFREFLNKLFVVHKISIWKKKISCQYRRVSPLSSQSKHLRTLLKKKLHLSYIITWKTYRTDVCLLFAAGPIAILQYSLLEKGVKQNKKYPTQLFSLSLDGQTQTVEIFRYTQNRPSILCVTLNRQKLKESNVSLL